MVIVYFVVPWLGRARRSLTGAPPSLVLGDEQPFLGVLVRDLRERQ